MTEITLQPPRTADFDADNTRRFREMIDALPAAIYTTDAKGKLTHFNPACVEFSGRTPELGTDHWCVTWKLYYPDGRPMPHDQCPMAIAVKTGRIIRGAEAIAERPDGTRIWFTPYPTPFYDAAGNITGGINMLVDITERKKADNVSREHEQTLYASAEKRIGQQRKLIESFSALRLDVGVSAEALLQNITEHARELIGAHQSVTSLTVGEDWSQAINALSLSEKYAEYQAYDAKPDGSGIYHLVCKLNRPFRMTQAELEAHPAWRGFGKDGAVHPPMRGWLAAPLIGPEGRSIGLIQLSDKYAGEFTEEDEVHLLQFAQVASGVLENIRLYKAAEREIAERKQAEQAMRDSVTAQRDAQRQAEEANHAKDKFLAVLSHELRTPLTPVLMTAAAMEMRDDIPPDVREDAAMIRRNVELQSRLIDDLLDLSRITSGKLRLSFDTQSINDLVRHACDTCTPNLRERGIELHCDLDADALSVVGDGTRLQQVFWNLLNNATKFTPEGGQVHVRAEDVEGKKVRVTVRDTGVGIAPDALERIFEAFEQAGQHGQGEGGVNRQFGGMGLGLAICRALVEQHHGTIRAHSDGKDKGATFVVELPAVPRPSKAGTRALPSVREKVRPLRLLLVEDDTVTATVLAKVLAAAGHDVKAATTAAEALKLAGEGDFDLVLSDLGLPDMTGYELMRQIKQRHFTKGIAMSGYGMEDDITRSQEAGFSDHLTKPVKLAQLEQSIRRVSQMQAVSGQAARWTFGSEAGCTSNP